MHSPVRFKLDGFIEYRMNTSLLLLSFCFSAVTLFVYAQYFDILAPFIPGGSVRANSGLFFILPTTLLLCGQTLFATWLTHVAIAMVAPGRKDALKAYFVASAQIMLFSFFYVMFPYYGPYTFVVYLMPGQSFGSASYPILVVWTVAIVVAGSLLFRRAFRLQNGTNFGPFRNLLFGATLLAVVMVMAS